MLAGEAGGTITQTGTPFTHHGDVDDAGAFFIRQHGGHWILQGKIRVAADHGGDARPRHCRRLPFVTSRPFLAKMPLSMAT